MTLASLGLLGMLRSPTVVNPKAKTPHPLATA